MDASEQRRIVEALVVASSEPVSAARLGAVVPDCDAARVRKLVAELNQEYREHGRAFEIEEVAGGFQLRTRLELAPWLRELRPQRPLRLSQASLETLAIVAYKQPLTRAEVEDVRGVECGAVLRTLMERRLVRIAGHREVPGRPLLYGTTRRFLEVFGLDSLRDLPNLRQLEELLPTPEQEAAEGGGESPAVEDAESAAPSGANGASELPTQPPSGLEPH